MITRRGPFDSPDDDFLILSGEAPHRANRLTLEALRQRGDLGWPQAANAVHPFALRDIPEREVWRFWRNDSLRKMRDALSHDRGALDLPYRVDNLLAASIGTPLFELPHLRSSYGRVLVKHEAYNGPLNLAHGYPTGCVKHSTAATMVALLLRAIAKGTVSLDGLHIFVPSSGSMSTASIESLRAAGFTCPVTLVVPAGYPAWRREIAEQLGGIEIVEVAESSLEAQTEAHERAIDAANGIVFDQYQPLTWTSPPMRVPPALLVNATYSGRDLVDQIGRQETVTHFVAGTGSGGSALGVAAALSQRHAPSIIFMQPSDSVAGTRNTHAQHQHASYSYGAGDIFGRNGDMLANAIVEVSQQEVAAEAALLAKVKEHPSPWPGPTGVGVSAVVRELKAQLDAAKEPHLIVTVWTDAAELYPELGALHRAPDADELTF